MKEYGKHFAELRKEYGFTQSELAERINVSVKTIQNWEHDVCLPDMDRLFCLADLYMISLDQLLRYKEENKISRLDGKRYVYKETIRLPYWEETYVDFFIDEGYGGIYQAWVYDNNFPKIEMRSDLIGNISYEEFKQDIIQESYNIVIEYRDQLDHMLPGDERRKAIREWEHIEIVEMMADGYLNSDGTINVKTKK